MELEVANCRGWWRVCVWTVMLNNEVMSVYWIDVRI